jgi:hypothetical protein
MVNSAATRIALTAWPRMTGASSARSGSVRSAATNNAVAAAAATTNPQAPASASEKRILFDIAYSPNNSRTFAIRSFVEKGLVT